MSGKIRRRIVGFLMALLLVGGALGAECYRSLHSLTTAVCRVSSGKLTEPVRLVLLADLHNNRFGENNEILVEKVRQQAPDQILLAGDILDAEEPDPGTAVELIRSLTGVAPVCVSLGNQEMEWQQFYGGDIAALYREAGARVLEYDWVDLTLRGQDIRIGGIYGYCVTHKLLETGESKQEECEFLWACQDTPRYRILLTHLPVCWNGNSLEDWDMDLVLAGHVHGGSVVLPLLGGLYGPDYGWFPGRLKGLFTDSTGEKALVITPGLGTSGSRPRFNNPPEITVVDLVPDVAKTLAKSGAME